MGQSDNRWTESLACRRVCVCTCVYSHFSSICSPPQAQLLDQRSELTEVKAEREVLEREVHDQLLQLHSLQLQLYAKQGQAEDSDTIKDRLVCRTREHTGTDSGERPTRWTVAKKES